ncbi:MAG: tRNA (adenosine(37)-N6)-threonylcarbamoyltransferase complex dimerization subunit type 1 TsaB [Anaerorhabdus sp.]
MVTLCLDTSQHYLTIVLIKNNEVLGQYSEICLKKQSEYIFPELIKQCDLAHVSPNEITSVVVTRGPGSYTGVRIAMSIAKVFCTQKKIALYTLSTLQLYAGLNERCWVIMDARANRAYVAEYQKGKLVGEEKILAIDEIVKLVKEDKVNGEGSLIGKKDSYPDFGMAFIGLQDEWQKVEEIHHLVPVYLKSEESYLVK